MVLYHIPAGGTTAKLPIAALVAPQGSADEEGWVRHRYAIITGDDFGFSHGVNRAIIAAHEHGVLTSASLMVTGRAADEAVALAHAHPRLAVGLHLVVVGGHTVLPPREIPHLTDRTGRFPHGPFRMGLRYQFNAAARLELRREIRAQLERFRQTGLRLSHVDGHLHMHTHPVVLRALIELASEFDIRAIRLPSEEFRLTCRLDRTRFPTKLLWARIFWRLRRYGEPRLRSAGIACAERVYGLLASGRMTEAYLLGLIPRIRVDCVEIYLHPALSLPGEPRNGPPGAGQAELAALLSERVRTALTTSGFALTNYRDAVAMRRR
jgi:hopanoid biosynthesis associated protein HpnK